MKLTVLLLLITVLSGCAGNALKDVSSVTEAGITTINSTPIVSDGKYLATAYEVSFGKEYDDISVTVSFYEDGRVKDVELSAKGIKAFEGQAKAAEITAQIQQTLSDAGVQITEGLTEAISAGVMKTFVP